MSFNNSSNSEGTQPLSVGDDRLASDSNFTDQSSAQPNPSDDFHQGGETVDQGGYGTSASGGDQFSQENQTGQGFGQASNAAQGAGQFKPSVQDFDGNNTARVDAQEDTDGVSHRETDM